MRPAGGRGSRGGADVLTLPWGSVVPRHSAMHDRCIRAAPCLSKRNKLSEPRWAFERQDPAGHMFFFASPTFGRRDHSSSHNGRRRVAGGLRAGGRRSKIPLRRSESFPNFATVRAAAIRGGARGRRPAGAEGGWGRGGEGGLRAPIQRSTPFGRRGPVQCKARAPPLPGVAGSGFGSQFKNLNPKRCTDPKMSKRHRTSPKKAFGSGHKTTRKVYRPTQKWPNAIDF